MSDWPDGFDLDALLAPIPGDAPVGVDLREDFSPQSPYYRLRDARSEARAGERAVDNNDPGADETLPAQRWRTVRDLAVRALAEKSKDIEIAAWMTEALVRSDGLRGLKAGASLIAGLAEAYWDQGVFPVPDEDGIATRVAPVTGLNGEGGDGTLSQPLRKLTLFARPDGSAMTFWRYEQSAELTGIADKNRLKQRLAAGVLPFEETEKEARAAGPARFAAMRVLTRDALAAWQRMADVLDGKAGADGPPTSGVRDLVNQILAVVVKYAPPEAAAPPPEEDAMADASEPGAASAGGPTAGGVAKAVSRDDMLRELSRIAEYFRRTEPHSPISDTLEEAVRRGRMSWPELLAELVPEVPARSQILVKLGIKPPDAAG